jgi:hypothetical protein
LNGAEHYKHAQQLITLPNNQVRVPGHKESIRTAQVHALLAIAEALGVNQPPPRPTNPDDDFQWGSGWPGVLERNKPGDHWPPRRGDLWLDKRSHTWLAVPFTYLAPPSSSGTPPLAGPVYLVCLDAVGDDTPEEINQTRGPMTLIFRPSLHDDCPF